MLLVDSAPVFAQMDARDMEICRQQCLSRARDASDPRYRSCVRTRCEGQRAQPQRKTQPRAAAPAVAAPPEGSWTLGNHAAVGTAVHVQTETGVIGLACSADGAAVRVTNGMFRSPVLSWITDTGTGATSIPMAPGAVYSEVTGNACDLGLPGLMAANSLVLIDAPVAAQGAGQGFVVGLPGGDVTLSTGAEALARFPNVRNVPLPGLATALGSLAQSCPGLAAAMAQPCP